MDITTCPNTTPPYAYRGLYEQSVVEASFAWLRRSRAVHQPQYTLADVAALEQHIATPLNGLMTSIDLGWQSCEQALALEEPGEQFTATVIALRSHDLRHIQTAVEAGLGNTRATKGLVSAFGWLPSEIIRPWTLRLLKGKDMNHKYLGVAACSVRRDDPGEILADILKRDDCRQHHALHARALRLAGELHRQDVMTTLCRAANSPEPAIFFWAHWSLILLGLHTAVNNLKSLVFAAGPYRARALAMAFRVLPMEQARAWILALSKDPANVPTAITATGALGDPQAVNWLIDNMADPRLARRAAQAFTDITGADLVKYQLHENQPPREAPPQDETADVHADLDEDGLPWPNINKVASLWRRHGANFMAGRRYFLGKAITPQWLQHHLAASDMRQRQAAALELALNHPTSRFVNTAAKVIP